jgi:hypothetical protein
MIMLGSEGERTKDGSRIYPVYPRQNYRGTKNRNATALRVEGWPTFKMSRAMKRDSVEGPTVAWTPPARCPSGPPWQWVLQFLHLHQRFPPAATGS